MNLPSNISAQFINRYQGADLSDVTTKIMGKTDSTLSYSWTADGLLAQIQQTGSTVSTKSVKYTYDDAQRRTKVERFSDVNNANPVFQTVTVYASAAGTTVQNKGNKGRIETITHSRGSTDLAKYNNYSWDAAGRLTNVSSATTSHASHDNTSTFTYDSVNQLVGADYTNTNYVDLNFAYDDNGNRNTNGNVPGADNRQASDASWTYSYDANGNMIKKIRKSDNKEINYTYDHRNRLTDINDQTSTPTKKVHYGYDALNRRYLMTLDNNADGSIEKTEYYINQGLRTDRGNAGDELALQLDGNGVVQRRILHGALVDEVLAEEVVTSPTASETLWTLTDEQGSVRDIAKVVNGTATVVNHIMYDAFGNTAAETDVAISHLFGYTGREFDRATGLQYNRERYYDPKSGRFISQDPMSFAAGDANLYRYVGNHGTYATDSSGLFADPLAFPNLSVNGKVFEFPMAPTGSRTDGDMKAADRIAKGLSSSYRDYASHGGTWHHKSFDSQTGKFTMQLVDSKIHKAGHIGGVLEYERWVQEILENGSYSSLNPDQAKAFQTALQSRVHMKEIGRRLKEKEIKLSVSLTNASADVAEVSLEKGGVVTKIVPAIGDGGKIVRVITKYAPGVGIAFAISAGQQAFANGGDSEAVATAVGRDLAGAELIEAGFQLVIVDGGGIVHDYVMNPGGVIARRASALTDRERAELIQQTNQWMKERQSISEILDESPPLSDAFSQFWDWCMGKEEPQKVRF